MYGASRAVDILFCQVTISSRYELIIGDIEVCLIEELGSVLQSRIGKRVSFLGNSLRRSLQRNQTYLCPTTQVGLS